MMLKLASDEAINLLRNEDLIEKSSILKFIVRCKTIKITTFEDIKAEKHKFHN